MLAEVRTSLAKHEVAGVRAYAPSPGYGLISPIKGSIGWRIVYEEPLSEAIISRRDIGNECRAMGERYGRSATERVYVIIGFPAYHRASASLRRR